MFLGPFCSTHYYIKVIIDREGLFAWDNKKKLTLKVVEELDLNEIDSVVAKPIVKLIDQALPSDERYGVLDATVRIWEL